MASPREKVRPTTAPSRPNREKVRPTAASFWQNREKTRPASPKTPKIGHFCRAGGTFSRFPIRITPQGELFRADPTVNDQSTRISGPVRTHKTTCIVPPRPNREKVRPTAALPPSPREKVRPTAASFWQNREKTRPASPKTPKIGHFCRAGGTFSRFPIRITPQGELFRADPTVNDQSTRISGPVRTHKTTCIVPPRPNREKVRPTAPSSWPNREKVRPTAALQPSPREIVRPTAASFWQNREKTHPASPKTPKTGHFCRAGRTFSRSPNTHRAIHGLPSQAHAP